MADPIEPNVADEAATQDKTLPVEKTATASDLQDKPAQTSAINPDVVPDSGPRGARVVDAAAGVGAGVVVAGATSAIYGMTQLKNVKPEEVISKLYTSSKERAEKLVPAIQEVITKSPLLGIKIDIDKLRISTEEIYKKYGVDIAALRSVNAELARGFFSKLKSEEALEVYKDLQKAVAGALVVPEHVSQEAIENILTSIAQTFKHKDITPYLDALKEAGFSFDRNAVKSSFEEALKKPVFQEAIGLFEAHRVNAKDNLNALRNSAPGVLEDFPKAFAESITIPGKTAEQVQELLKNPASIPAELKSMAKKTLEDSSKKVKPEAKGLIVDIENTGRKLWGSVKYKHASWYEKPFVAFEAMPTKGKVALGAAVIVTTPLVTMAVSKAHKSSHAEGVESRRNSGSQEIQ